jgi:hypothetical protein
MTLNEVLVYATTVTGVGAIIAFVTERVPGFEYLKAEIKASIVLILSFAIPLGALAISMYVPPEFITKMEPWFAMLLIGFSVWTGTQVAHGVDKKLNDV